MPPTSLHLLFLAMSSPPAVATPPLARVRRADGSGEALSALLSQLALASPTTTDAGAARVRSRTAANVSPASMVIVDVGEKTVAEERALRHASAAQTTANCMAMISKMQSHDQRQPLMGERWRQLPLPQQEALARFPHSSTLPPPGPRPPATWRSNGGLCLHTGQGIKACMRPTHGQSLYGWLPGDYERPVLVMSAGTAEARPELVNYLLFEDPLGRYAHHVLLDAGFNIDPKSGRILSRATMACRVSHMIDLFFTARHEYAWTVQDNKHGASEWSFVRRLEDFDKEGATNGGSGVFAAKPLALAEFAFSGRILFAHDREDYHPGVAELATLAGGTLEGHKAAAARDDAAFDELLQSMMCGKIFGEDTSEPRKCTLPCGHAGCCGLADAAEAAERHACTRRAGHAAAASHAAAIAKQKQDAVIAKAVEAAASSSLDDFSSRGFSLEVVEDYLALVGGGMKAISPLITATRPAYVPSLEAHSLCFLKAGGLSGGVNNVTSVAACRKAYDETGVHAALAAALQAYAEAREPKHVPYTTFQSGQTRDAPWHAAAIAIALKRAQPPVSPWQVCGLPEPMREDEADS